MNIGSRLFRGSQEAAIITLQMNSFGSLFGTVLVDHMEQFERVMVCICNLCLICQLLQALEFDGFGNLGLDTLKMSKLGKMPPFLKDLFEANMGKKSSSACNASTSEQQMPSSHPTFRQSWSQSDALYLPA